MGIHKSFWESPLQGLLYFGAVMGSPHLGKLPYRCKGVGGVRGWDSQNRGCLKVCFMLFMFLRRLYCGLIMGHISELEA